MCNDSKSQPVPSEDQLITAILEKLWLTYYNDTLYSKGLLMPLQYRKTKQMILTRGSSKSSPSYKRGKEHGT